jgi:hypothetical protein
VLTNARGHVHVDSLPPPQPHTALRRASVPAPRDANQHANDVFALARGKDVTTLVSLLVGVCLVWPLVAMKHAEVTLAHEFLHRKKPDWLIQ